MPDSQKLKQAIRNFVAARGACNTTAVARAFGLTAYQARYYLLELRGEGVLERSPSQRGKRTEWYICGASAEINT